MEQKLLKKNIGLGFITITIWCVLTAAGYVYTSSLEQHIPVALMCFIIFGFSTLVFILLNVRNIPRLVEKGQHHLRSIYIINVTTFGGWVLVIYAIKYIQPSVANTMILAFIPIFTLLLNKFNRHQLTMNKQNYITALLLGAGVLYLSGLLLTGNTLSFGASLKEVVIAVMICFISGAFLAINNIHIKKLSDAQFGPLDILTVRFMFCAVTTGIYSLWSQEWNAGVSFVDLQPIFLNAFVLIIVPQIAIQISLRELEPFTVSVIMPFMPVLMFFMESFSQRLHPTVEAFVGIMAICGISFGGSVFRYRAERLTRQLVSDPL
jgi:drug/metabolite transporter (DMT)-like permease